MKNVRKMCKAKYVCIVDTVYALMLYLLYQSIEQIEMSMFLLGPVISREIARSLPRCLYPKAYTIQNIKSLSSFLTSLPKGGWISILLDRIILWLIHLRFVKGRKVFAQDHIDFASRVLCRNPYVLLEDGPCIYSAPKPFGVERKCPKGFCALKDYIMFGAIHNKFLGENKFCISRLVTEPDDLKSFFLYGKKCDLVSLKGLWENSSQEKKQFILRVFNIDEWLIDAMSESETLLLSQAFCADCGLSEAELVEIYRPYVERYRSGGVTIKVHPRDIIQYEKYFPYAHIIRVKAPMQLLSIIGRPPKRVVTIATSSLSDFPDNTEIVWIGTQIDKRIFNNYSTLHPPKRFTNIIYPNGRP